MMPLRAFVSKIRHRGGDFFPSAQDLYLHVRGDEWVDWLDIYLSPSGESIEQNPD